MILASEFVGEEADPSTPIGPVSNPRWSERVEKEGNSFQYLPASLDVISNRDEGKSRSNLGDPVVTGDSEILVENVRAVHNQVDGRGRGGGSYRGARGGRGGNGGRRSMAEEGPNQPQRSWANVAAASTRSNIKLRYIPPTHVDDAVVVNMPLRSDPLERWDSCLVGYFIDKGVGYNYLRNSAFGLWKDKGLKEVLTNGDGFMFFIFESPDCCREVLEEGPWYIGGYLLILKQWKRMMKLAKEKSTRIPVWVKFFNIPLEYWDPDGLSRIASAIGSPLCMDQLTARGTRVAFARICVEIEATSKLPTSFQMRCEEEAVLIRVEYQGLPSICQHCQIFGHDTQKCVSKQVAHLIALQKNSEETTEVQEEGWTTVKGKGKRKEGDPDPVLTENVEDPITHPVLLVPITITPEVESPIPAVDTSSSVEELGSAGNEVTLFQDSVLELTKVVLPQAAELLEAVIADAIPAKVSSSGAVPVHKSVQAQGSKSSGKGNSGQRKKKK